MQTVLGIDEQEFYRMYPIGWRIAITLGLLYIVAIVYTIKKTLDVHPNIQLRKKADEDIQKVLDDATYESWHDEAERLLATRRSRRRL